MVPVCVVVPATPPSTFFPVNDHACVQPLAGHRRALVGHCAQLLLDVGLFVSGGASPRLIS